MIHDIKIFASKVVAMREAQKKFFLYIKTMKQKDRVEFPKSFLQIKNDLLETSKQLEKEVDSLSKEILSEQTSLTL